MVGFKQKALFPKPNLPFSRFIKWSHRLPVLPIVVDGGWISKWTLALQDNTGRQHLPNPESVVSPVFFERDTESHAKSRVQGRKHSFLSSRASYYYTDLRVSHTTLLT